MVRLGIIGAGSIVQLRHMPEAELCTDCEIVGYFNRTEARARELAARYGGTVYASLEDLLGDPGIDGVIVANPNALHAPVTIQALEAGKHVFCEKPMATTVAECEAMIGAAKKAGRKLMLGHNMRTEPSSVIARQILERGEIGRVLSFHAVIGNPGPEYWSVLKSFDTWFYSEEQARFGAIGDLGVHKIDLMRFLLGDEVEEVQAYVATLDKHEVAGRPIKLDDYAACLLRTRGGAVGSVLAAWSFYGEDDYATTIRGSSGTLKIYADPDAPVVVLTEKGKVTYHPVEHMLGGERNSGLIQAFADCIQHDVEPPITGYDGLQSVRIIVACIESSRNGRAVRLQE